MMNSKMYDLYTGELTQKEFEEAVNPLGLPDEEWNKPRPRKYKFQRLHDDLINAVLEIPKFDEQEGT